MSRGAFFTSFERAGGELLFKYTTAPPRAARRENAHNRSGVDHFLSTILISF